MGAVACIAPSLLDEGYCGRKMELKEFEEWLTLYDKRAKKLYREKILKALGLPVEELQKLYSDLCKYVHISERSFDHRMIWPNIQYLPEKFDEVFALLMKTIDLIFWLECKMLLQFNGKTKKALRAFREHLDSFITKIPMTMRLLSSL